MDTETNTSDDDSGVGWDSLVDAGDGVEVGWASVAEAEDSQEAREPVPIQQVVQGEVKEKRGRGRPRGIYGSHAFRRELKQSRESMVVPRPSLSREEILAKAREAKAARRNLHDAATRASSSATAQSRPSGHVMSDAVPGLGTWLAQQCVQAAAAGMSMVRGDAAQADHIPDIGFMRSFASRLLFGKDSAPQAAPEINKPQAEDNSSEVEQIQRTMAHVFQPYRGYCSIARDSEFLKVDERSFSRSLGYSAAAFQNLSCKLWGNMFAKIREKLGKSHDGVLFVAKLRFDETPSRIAVQDLNSSSATISNLSSSVVLSSQQSGRKPAKPARKQLAKILQTEFNVAALLKSKESGKHLLISGSVPAPLQVLDRQTGANLASALEDTLRIPTLDTFADSFCHKLFLYTTDEFASNDVAEWALQQKRRGWMRMNFLCDVHKGSTCQGRVFDLTGPAISAVINFALSMCPAGSLGKMQSLLSDILTSKFQLKIGEPPYNADALAYKSEVLDLFCSVPDTFSMEVTQSTSSRQRLQYGQKLRQRSILEFWLNDDLRDHSKIIHWAKSGQYRNEDEALELFLHFVVPALLPCACPIFPRSRWFGADASLDFVGLLSCCHNLFEPLIAAWSGRQLPSSDAILPASEASDDDDLGWDAFAPVQALAAGQKPRPKRESKNDQQVEESSAPDLQSQPQPMELPPQDGPSDEVGAAFDWHAYQERLKTSVGEWVCGWRASSSPSPQALLALMRQFLTPILLLMTHLLYLGSQKFSKVQYQKSCDGLQQEFRVLIAWVRRQTTRLIVDVLALMKSPPKALGIADLRADIGVLCFCMLSRLACSTYQLLHWRHGKYPYRLFSALQSKDQACNVFNDPRCVQDEVAQALCKTYSTVEAFCSPECVAVLETIAVLADTDIGAIERQHTLSRKVIQSRSLAKAATLKTLNADWLLRRACQNKASLLTYNYFDSRESRRKLSTFHKTRLKTVKKKEKRWRGSLAGLCVGYVKGYEVEPTVCEATRGCLQCFERRGSCCIQERWPLCYYKPQAWLQGFWNQKTEEGGNTCSSCSRHTNLLYRYRCWLSRLCCFGAGS